MGEIAQPVQKSVDGLLGAAGLEHDAGNVVRVFGEDFFGTGEVVVTETHRLLGCFRRDTPRYSCRHHEPVVVREERMVRADRDLDATGMGSCELHRGRNHRRAVLRELHHLRMGQHTEQRLGTLHLDRRRPVEIRPELHLAHRGIDDRRVGMT